MFEFLRRILKGDPAPPSSPSPPPSSTEGPPPATVLRGLEAGEMELLAWAIALLFGGDERLSRAAAEAMSRTAGAMPPARIPRVDATARMSPWTNGWYSIYAWGDDGSRTRALPEETETGVFALLSVHASGYVREVVVERLAARGAEALPWLLLRANDWVPPIREAAEKAVRALLVPEHAGAWAAALPSVVPLAETPRYDRSFVREVTAFLSRPDVAPAVMDALPSLFHDDPRAALWVFRVLGDAGTIPVAELVDRAQWSPDAKLRLHAARLLRRADAETVRDARHMAGDASRAVRAEYLRQLAERVGDDAWFDLHDVLLDSSANIRALAVFHLRRWGDFDAAAFYRAAATQPATVGPTVAALRGLADHGTAEDAYLALAHSIGLRARVRAASVTAYVALARPADPAVLEILLRDRSPRVRRATKIALERLASRR